MQFAQMLKNRGLTSGPVFATRLMKGRDILKAIADCKAQDTIRVAHTTIISEAEPVGSIAHLVDRLATFYHSDHVKVCQPEILETPFIEWRDRQLAAKGIVL